MFKVLKELFGLLTSKQRKRFVFLQLLVTVSAIVEIVSVASVAPFMALVSDTSILLDDNLLAHLYKLSNFSDPYDFIILIGGLVLIFMVIGSLVSIFTTWKLSLFAQHTGMEIGNSLFRLYLTKEWSFHSRTNSAILTKKIATESVRVTNLILTPLMQINSRIVLIILMSIGVLIIDPIIAISGCLIFGASYFIIFKYSKRKLFNNGVIVSEETTERFKLMSEGFGGVKDLILLGRQELFNQRFESSGHSLAFSQGTNDTLSLAPRYLMELVAFGSIIVLLLVMVSNHNGDVSKILPSLTVYALAGFKILPAFQQVYYGLSRVKGNISAYYAIREELLTIRDLTEAEIEETIQQTLIFKENISLKNVNFAYSGSDRLVLDNTSLNIPANSIVGFVGTTGAGKSTLIDLILGLIFPCSGSIFVDNVPLNKLNLRSWQDRIGYVPQSVFLSDGTIMENIAFGLSQQNIDQSKVNRACELACVDEFLNDLPDGLLTKVGERGVQLSGGQRQRIGLARALYNNADVIVLDEATSALDGATEKKVINAIKGLRGKKTILMIAHRLSTIKDCDIIYFMDNGGVAYSGTYNELIEKSSEFRVMADIS